MKKPKSCLTFVHNEPRFLPLYLRYYSRYFDMSCIHVIHVLKPRRLPFDDWLINQARVQGFTLHPYEEKQICEFQVAVDHVQEVQRKLLEEYDVVVFSEVDEFICCESGMDDYISRFSGDFVRCTGYEVIHHATEEPAIDLSMPIMPQRNWWSPDELYNKPLITRVPLKYILGFHRCHEDPDRINDPSLFLVHLRRVDYQLCVDRALERQRNEDDSALSKLKKQGDPGWQHYQDQFEMTNWFNLARANEELIPAFAKQFPI